MDFELLKKIVEQIKHDADNEDYTAIELLFKEIPINKLKGFLNDDL